MDRNHTNVKMPTFFIVGAPKCGTTALYNYLSEHPQIFMSPLKEPQFFAQDLLGDKRRVQDLEEYLACFSGAGDEKMIGEASAAYFASTVAPKEIKRFAPGARIIVMLRNPVDKMYSRFIDARFNNLEHHESLEAALDTEQRCGPSFGLGYMESARYSVRVRRYLETFGRENVHVVIFDDFAERTAATYQDTLSFLGVSPDSRSHFPVVNGSRYVRSMVLQEFVRHPPRFLRQFGHVTMPLRVRKRLRGWFSHHNVICARPPANRPALRERLQREFENDVEDLGQLINRDLSHWSKH